MLGARGAEVGGTGERGDGGKKGGRRGSIFFSDVQASLKVSYENPKGKNGKRDKDPEKKKGTTTKEK